MITMWITLRMSLIVVGSCLQAVGTVFFSGEPPDLLIPNNMPLHQPLLYLYVHEEPTSQNPDQSYNLVECHVSGTSQDGVHLDGDSHFAVNSSALYLYIRSPLDIPLTISNSSYTSFALTIECTSPFATSSSSTTTTISVTTFERWHHLSCTERTKPGITMELASICFQDSVQEFSVYENMKGVILGDISPGLPVGCQLQDTQRASYQITPQGAVNFDLSGTKLTITEPLDHEMNDTVSLTIKCTRLGSRGSVSRDFSVRVLDVHDCGPVIPLRIKQTTSYTKRADLTLEPDKEKAIMFSGCIAGGHVTPDEDYVVTVTRDPQQILRVSDVTTSFGRKKIVFEVTDQPDVDLNAVVTVNDTTVVSRDPSESKIVFHVFAKGRRRQPVSPTSPNQETGHSHKPTRPNTVARNFTAQQQFTQGEVTRGAEQRNDSGSVPESRQSTNSVIPAPAGLTQTTGRWHPAATNSDGAVSEELEPATYELTNYEYANVSAAAAKYTTVTKLFSEIRGDYRYSTVFQEKHLFNITEDTVYVAGNLSASAGENLTLHIKGVMEGLNTILVELTVAVLPTEIPLLANCDRSCSVAMTKEECTDMCGYGAATGRCVWVVDAAQTHYSTCVGDPVTCPDNVCKGELEEKTVPELCPQDCSNNKNGISLSEVGVCYCHPPADYCNCTLPPPKEAGSTESSGEDNQWVIVLSLVVGLVLASCLLVVLWRCRNRIKQSAMKHVSSIVSLSAVPSDYVEDSDRNGGQLTGIDWNTQLLDARFKPDPQWEFPRRNIRLEKTLGEGEFGRVLKARALSIQGSQGFTTVAVKMLKECASSAELRDLLSEYSLLKDVSHRNVIKLLGVSSQNGPFFLIVEYCEHGSLRSYLRRSRQASYITTNTTPEADDVIQTATETKMAGCTDVIVTEKDLISFAWQTAKGMQYLCEMKLVHRDLAARNILIATGKVIKVSDFGLTRDIYEGDAYLKRSKGRIPVKWMAPESLYDQVYTSKSDVWSFGVVLWEVATLGATPYPGVPPERLYQMIKGGYRLDKPQGCSDDLFHMMQRCWREDPVERHSFKYIASQFEAMLTASTCYLDLTYQSDRHLILDEDTSDSVGSFGNLKGSITQQEPDYGSINILPTDSNSYVLTPKLHNNGDAIFNKWSSCDGVHSPDVAHEERRFVETEAETDDNSSNRDVPMTTTQYSIHEMEGLMSEHMV